MRLASGWTVMSTLSSTVAPAASNPRPSWIWWRAAPRWCGWARAIRLPFNSVRRAHSAPQAAGHPAVENPSYSPEPSAIMPPLEKWHATGSNSPEEAAAGQEKYKGRVLSNVNAQQRVLSGMRPTGRLHLGHLHGVLKNWIALQEKYQCYFFVADWHALTTHYSDPGILEESVHDMVIDWLAVGVDPARAALFIQSQVPEHAELHLLLSMITPLGWLERVPSYKDQKEKLKDRDLETY